MRKFAQTMLILLLMFVKSAEFLIHNDSSPKHNAVSLSSNLVAEQIPWIYLSVRPHASACDA
ncbi:unnamed protein product [Prunus armeniaca]